MLHVLVGEDDYSIRQALEEIKKAIGDATALMTNTTILEGPALTPDQLRAAETFPPPINNCKIINILIILPDIIETLRSIRRRLWPGIVRPNCTTSKHKTAKSKTKQTKINKYFHFLSLRICANSCSRKFYNMLNSFRCI